MPREVRITIFIVLVLLVAIFYFALFFYKPLRKIYYHHRPKEFFYHKIMKVVRNGDFYLLNNLELSLGDKDKAVIDHLMCGDKYLYVMMDFYCEGALSASPSDSRWIYYRKDGKKEEVSNPLIIAKNALMRLAMQTGINNRFFIGLVLINDDCFVNPFKNEDNDVLLVPLSKLQKVVDKYEASEVNGFVPKELYQVVHDLYELNQKGKTNE